RWPDGETRRAPNVLARDPIVRACPLAFPIAASLMLARSARGDGSRAARSLEASFMVLPLTPGASDLARATPAPVIDVARRPRMASSLLASIGLGAGAIWVSGATITTTTTRAIDFASAAGFVAASVGTSAVLASRLFFLGPARFDDARVLILLGPGGGGVA